MSGLATEHRPMFGESGYQRAAHDAYWTPEWCTNVLLDVCKLRGTVWEPASGKGNICRVLGRRDYAVIATDLVDHGHFDRLEDFLKARHIPYGVESIVTNPPYYIAEEFVRHALLLTSEVRGQVAMLLRNEFDSASSRTELFDRPPFERKHVLTRRPRWSDDDKASPRHNFAWFIWDWKHHGNAFISYQPKVSP